MSASFVLKLLTQWQMLFIGGLIILFLPLVARIASLKPRRRRTEFIPPAEKALRPTAE